MSFVDWNYSSSGGKGNFLNLVSGNQYRVRPIGQPVIMHKYFRTDENGKTRTAITADPESCSVAQKHPDLKPTTRYGVYVIDRNDDNKVKVMEFPQSVFNAFGQWAQNMKIKPGGKEAFDWSINVTGAGLKKRYNASALEKTPLTQEEISAYKEAVEQNPLDSVFAPDSDEEIEKKLFDVVSDNDSGSDDSDDLIGNDSSGDDLDF